MNRKSRAHRRNDPQDQRFRRVHRGAVPQRVLASKPLKMQAVKPVFPGCSDERSEWRFHSNRDGNFLQCARHRCASKRYTAIACAYETIKVKSLYLFMVKWLYLTGTAWLTGSSTAQGPVCGFRANARPCSPTCSFLGSTKNPVRTWRSQFDGVGENALDTASVPRKTQPLRRKRQHPAADANRDLAFVTACWSTCFNAARGEAAIGGG